MKHLRVIVNTHKRPAQALAVIECLRAMASGRHRVSYVLAYDEGDTATENFIFDVSDQFDGRTRLDIELDRRPRPASVADCWNRNLRNPDAADIWLVMADDGFCAAPHWDALIVDTMAHAPVPDLAVLGWKDQANPTQLTVPIVAAGWLKALAPEPLLDPRFPFWFADTAISETWSYVFGMPVPCPEFLLLAGPPGVPNPRLLEEGADKWWDLYAATRVERFEQARIIRHAHGLPLPPRLSLLTKAWKDRDVQGREDTRKLVEHLRAKMPA